MGPRQRAQARKKGNGGGNQSQTSSPWTQNYSPSPSPWSEGKTKGPNARHRGVLSDWKDFSDSNTSRPQEAMLSMNQAARNTERHAMAWGSSKLRDQTITFVSAGNLKQDDIDAIAEETAHKKDITGTDLKLEDKQTSAIKPTSLPGEKQTTETPFIDKEGPVLNKDPPIEPAARAPPPRRDSTSSQSSEEILFAGRRNPQPKSSVKHTPPTSKSTSPPGPKSANIDATPWMTTSSYEGAAQDPSPPGPKSVGTDAPPWSSAKPLEFAAQDSSSSGLDRFDKIFSTPQTSRAVDRRGRTRLRPGNTRRKDDDEAIMNDYIANMTFEDDEDDDDDKTPSKAHSVKAGRRTEHFRFFDGVPEPKVSIRSKPVKEHTQRFKPDQAIDWDSADLRDFDDFSTTDEEFVEVSQVLRYRTRPSGPQYLVSPLGNGVSDPRWVLHDKLKSSSAVEEIRIFEEIRAMKVQDTTSDSEESGSSKDEVEDDLMDDIESEENENDRILKHTSRMTDEQIAKTLAKQEELGLGGDELLLLDGTVDDLDYGDQQAEIDPEDEFAAGDGFIPFSVKQHLSSRTTSKRNKRQQDHFPSASALADALDQDPYGAFDIMDFDRPSLKPKKKGRKSDLPFELGVEDPELADRLRNTWEKDREKKTARKIEKQAERETALVDASERNHPAAIKAEIRQFLMQEVTNLELAPMDAAMRASVHRLAKSLKLQSKSQGKDGHGLGRYPVLSKGPHTPRHTIDTIWEIDALLESRKFFPKQGFSSYNGRKVNTPGPARARRGGGGVLAGATYLNGDVVGASAPELAADNKGRAMLQKMGWDGKEGIGAAGNKGSIDVIKHVMKTTKAGLG